MSPFQSLGIVMEPVEASLNICLYLNPLAHIVKKATTKGFINIKGKILKLDCGLAEQWVAAGETQHRDILEIYFCNGKIKDIFINK